MVARRLPVLSSLARGTAAFDPLDPLAEPEAAPQRVRRSFLPGRAIVLGDTGDGELALRFGAQLVDGLSERGVRPAVCMVGFGPDPGFGLEQRARFGGADPVTVLSLTPELVLPRDIAGADPTALWIMVGPGALLGFESKLSFLLGADRSVLRWPEALRALRGSFALELSGGGSVALAFALAQRLVGG